MRSRQSVLVGYLYLLGSSLAAGSGCVPVARSRHTSQCPEAHPCHTALEITLQLGS